MDLVRYGVFKLGQYWMVVCDDGGKIGFPTRDLAIDAAVDMVQLHRSYGSTTELLVQDDAGAVRLMQPST